MNSASKVPDPDEAGPQPEGLRFILKLRATGEGHNSSITFRSGTIHPDQGIEVFPVWNERGMLLKPAFAWELVQLGNCGSPIETDAGWLVLMEQQGS